MAPPLDVLDAAQRLSDTYTTALDHIRAQIEAVGSDVNRTALRRRLRDLERTITQLVAEIDVEAQQWVNTELPRTYERGMGSFVNQTAAVRGATPGQVLVDFTMPSRPAVERMASGLTDDLLSASREVTQSAKRQIRAAMSDAGMAKLLEGKSLGEASQQVADALDGMGLGTVTYANGASVPLDVYADMAVRTTTALAYNGGMLDAGTANGTEWFECFDSAECGLEDHDSDEKPDGKVYSVDVAEEYSISHPNCVRSWGARPDVTSADEAANADPIGEETLSLDAVLPDEIAAPAEPAWPLADDAVRGEAVPSVVEDATQRYADWGSNLDGDQYQALNHYTRSGYGEINKALREGQALSSSMADSVQMIDEALASAPQLAEPTLTWRSMSLAGQPGASNPLDWARSAFSPGDEIELPSYQSTSLSPSVAHRYTHIQESFLFEIEAQQGAYLNVAGPLGADFTISTFNKEVEFLLPRSGRYEVVDVIEATFDQERRTVVKLRQL